MTQNTASMARRCGQRSLLLILGFASVYYIQLWTRTRIVTVLQDRAELEKRDVPSEEVLRAIRTKGQQRSLWDMPQMQIRVEKNEHVGAETHIRQDSLRAKSKSHVKRDKNEKALSKTHTKKGRIANVNSQSPNNLKLFQIERENHKSDRFRNVNKNRGNDNKRKARHRYNPVEKKKLPSSNHANKFKKGKRKYQKNNVSKKENRNYGESHANEVKRSFSWENIGDKQIHPRQTKKKQGLTNIEENKYEIGMTKRKKTKWLTHKQKEKKNTDHKDYQTERAGKGSLRYGTIKYSPDVFKHDIPKNKQHNNVDKNENMLKYKNNTSYTSFRVALSKSASKKKVLILTIFDEGFADIAINFFETSLKKHSIKNFLFISISKFGCYEILEYGIPCYHDNSFEFSFNGNVPSKYGEDDFWKKVNSRHLFVYHALKWGYTVFHVDPDVVFLKNPFKNPYFTCSTCAVVGMADGEEEFLNIGSVLLRPSKNLVQLYNEFIYLIDKYPVSNEQGNFNTLVGLYREKKTFSVRFMPENEFINGMTYFDKGHRYFAGDGPPCDACQVVHNNWIVSKAGKIYRFKENHMWLYDKHGYYSNLTTKFIIYDNPFDFNNETLTRDMEQVALISALAIAQVLNRKVIFPKFHCINYSCPFSSHYAVRDFDKEFSENYREHTFLTHPKVPESIKRDISPLLTIHSRLSMYYNASLWRTAGTHFSPQHTTGATSREITQWFQRFQHYRVLRFHSLYGAFSHFTDKSKQDIFAAKVNRALKFANSEQNYVT